MKREYPLRPIPGVGAVLIKKGKVLLVKRTHEPGKGSWSIPGGVVEVGESIETAVVREVKEETGFDVQIRELLGVTDIIIPDEDDKVKFHYVLTYFLVQIIGGSLADTPDQSMIKWVNIDQINSLDVTKTVLKILKKVGFIKNNL